MSASLVGSEMCIRDSPFSFLLLNVSSFHRLLGGVALHLRDLEVVRSFGPERRVRSGPILAPL
eukprot:10385458-Alexandrium_andersonii.AAC.1